MEIKLTSHYLRSLRQFVKNKRLNASNVKKVLSLFQENPRHPSLNLEKLGGTKLWTIRIDSSNRIFFLLSDDFIAILVDIGKHDKYKRY